MSDVNVTPEQLKCLICNEPARSLSGLAWHRRSRHKQLGQRSLAGIPQVVTRGASSSSTLAGTLGGTHGAAPPSISELAVGNATDGAPSGPAGERVDEAAAVAPGPVMRAPTSMRPDSRMSRAVAGEMDALERLTGRLLRGVQPLRKKKKTGGDSSDQPQVQYSTLSTALRAFFESKSDWMRSKPLVTPRKGWRPGQFQYFRTRAIQRFALKVCGRGLSRDELVALYELLDIWDRTMPGMPVDEGHMLGLRDMFPTVNSFLDAMSDDVDAAVLEEGWMKVEIEESGHTYTAYFRSALEVSIILLAAAEKVQLWSGNGKPAEPSPKRETPMEGDAFRLHEKAVVDEHGSTSFVIGMHVFSDECKISWRGGMCLCCDSREGGGRLEESCGCRGSEQMSLQCICRS